MDKPGLDNVVLHERDTIVFPFGGAPYVPVVYGTKTCSIDVDPFPGYAHDRFQVADHLTHVAKCFPLGQDVTINLLSYETASRVNGRANMVINTESGTRHGIIVLDGKRTPIHPAMSRYLVAHEYGHLVQFEIERLSGMEPGDFEAIYAERRGMKMQKTYGGGNWHLTPGEVMANDFRIVVCRSEVAFWPHPETARPEEHLKIASIWEELKHEYAWKPEGTELALAS